MSEKATDVDVEVENPHDHVAHRSGHAWLDKVLPISALFVSFISILIAWHHGEVMQGLVHQNERLVQANSLPYLQMYSNQGADHFDLFISNAGIGPAEVRTAELLVDGKPVATLEDFLKACCNVSGRGGVSKSNVIGQMIRPGVDVPYISADETNLALVQTIARAYHERRLETRLCYCSVFDECWTRSSRDFANAVRPKRVDSCPMPTVPYRS